MSLEQTHRPPEQTNLEIAQHSHRGFSHLQDIPVSLCLGCPIKYIVIYARHSLPFLAV